MRANHANGSVGGTTRHRIAVLLLEPAIGFDATIPPLLFGEATGEDGTPLYDVVLCALRPGPVRTTSGYALVATAGPEALTAADTVIVPGTRYAPARRDGQPAPELAAALAAVPAGTRMVSICTGAFVLAAAGLLNGRRATTHWQYADAFRRLYPAVELDEAVLFVDEGNLLSSAGLAAGIDLCLHIIRRDHGAAMANRVARHCVVPVFREGGQAQFIEHHIPENDDRSTAAARAWALGHLAEPLSVATLAARARMSPRTFSRRFQAETGMSPGAWLRDRRIQRARELLESADIPVDAVAAMSGLGSPDNLRHHLRRSLGMSPSAYRRTFTAP